MKNVSQYDQEMLQSHTIYLPTAPEKRAEERQQKDYKTKASSPLSPSGMIVNLERSQSTAYQNMIVT